MVLLVPGAGALDVSGCALDLSASTSSSSDKDGEEGSRWYGTTIAKRSGRGGSSSSSTSSSTSKKGMGVAVALVLIAVFGSGAWWGLRARRERLERLRSLAEAYDSKVK